MGKYTGPKNRLSRREGVDLFGKGQADLWLVRAPIQ